VRNAIFTSILVFVLVSQLEVAAPMAIAGNAAIQKELETVSRLDFIRHPVSLGSLVSVLVSYAKFGSIDESQKDDESSAKIWSNISMYVDEPAFAKNGVDLDNTSFFGPGGELRAGGVSKRSSLRFVLDACGASYYVGDEQLVITTKSVARASWLAQLTKPDPASLGSNFLDERRRTAFAAGFWSLDPDVWVEPLIRSLRDPDRQVAFDSAFALGELGPLANRAIVPLIDVLTSNDLTLREAACYAIAKIGPQAIDVLLKQVGDPDASIAIAAAKSLGLMGNASRRTVPSLIDIGKRRFEEIEVRMMISDVIASVDPKGSLSSLRQLMKNENASTRVFGVETIGRIGEVVPSSKQSIAGLDEIVHQIMELLLDENVEVRRGAAAALWQIDIPLETPREPLERAKQDKDSQVSQFATIALHLLDKRKTNDKPLFD
jgi:HEAT repeat protein